MARARSAGRLGRTAVTAGLLAAVLAFTGGGPAAAPAAAEERAADVVPLSAELEEARAAQAETLYGDAAIRPMDERKTSLISLGDSEISGEGVGTYEPGTDGPDNWCHRSPDAAIHRTGIPADVTFNVACSGASTVNIRIGGTPQYADELVQSDNLAIKARNTRIQQIVLVAGANDDLRFGPVITDCVVRWFTFQGACHPKYRPGWQARVDGLQPKVVATVGDLRTVMRQAGYADDDYQLVVMGYPGPLGPDVYDNPDYPGKLFGGCTGYDSDAAFARNFAVPVFEKGMREAARQAGATYLDASRLFHGHEVCMENTWARGLYVDLTNPFPPDSNSVRQSFHPNKRGHGAFAACFTAVYQAGQQGVREASCADPSGAGQPRLYELAWDDVFGPLRNEATGSCLDAEGASSRNGTAVGGWSCNGERNQGWWLDPETRQLYTELSHDRCLDVPDGEYEAGAGLALWNCHGGANQQFVRDGATLRPAGATALCLTLAGATEPVRLQECDGSAAQRFA
ncbi:ricin-type beta-trefoil lectin domain protein [Streptomyces sp. DSM 42041]|uniref:Ricin-type beta-trefoil lectin domain protein n=1 Tax=Streptomyces hazeniae TaxID=3075538 RepID=A0ABU2NTV1_9ACTN|nr:ricin-type beta-trefoil lectin domain protein [Streptomyces sp. DSM 42041]MDT0380155.1 ricin-type beta-trefoil lectin domain protein [Streptomyces sp. DSM 42041]